MEKRTVTRVWLWGLALGVVGAILIATGVGVMLGTAGTWTQTSSGAWNFAPSYGGLFYSMIALIAVGGVLVLTAFVMQFVAWIGAMVHTARFHETTWFVLLLVLGLIGFQFIIMVVYLIAGPDVPRLPGYGWPAPPPVPPPVARPA